VSKPLGNGQIPQIEKGKWYCELFRGKGNKTKQLDQMKGIRIHIEKHNLKSENRGGRYMYFTEKDIGHKEGRQNILGKLEGGKEQKVGSLEKKNFRTAASRGGKGE